MDQSLNLFDLARGVWARKMLMVLIFALVMVGVAFVIVTATPKYTSSLQVIVESDDNPYTRVQETRAPTQVSESEVSSQVQILMSADLARRVIERLNLASRSEFDPLVNGLSFKKRMLIMLGLTPDPRAQTAEQRALETYYDDIKVYQMQDSRVITVDYTSSDPQIAADVANAVGETYVVATREVKLETARDAMQWLSAEITRLRQRVAESEAAVEEFRAANGLLRAENTTLTGQELAGINEQIVLAAAARSEAQARANAIRDQLERTGTVENSNDVLNSNVIQNLREQQVTLQRQRADLANTYLPSHPRMVRLDAEIANLNGQVRAEALKIVEALEEEASVQGAREATLRASLAQLTTRESSNNQDAITLRALEREAEANRTLLQTFMQRFSEASARQDIYALPPGARIVSRAQVLGQPTFPKKGPMLMLGIAAAAALALLCAFAAEILNPRAPRAQSAQAVEPRLADPVMSAAPPPMTASPAAPAPERMPQPALGPVVQEFPPIAVSEGQLGDAAAEAVRDPTTELAVAVRRLNQRIEDERRATGSARVLWTGRDCSDERAIIVANLARSVALAGTKVVVVDADVVSGRLSEAFRVPPGPGLAELIQNRASFADAIARDPLSGAHMMRAGTQTGRPAIELLESARVGYILDALDHTYDVVIVNGPTVTNTDGQGLAAKMPFAVIVAHGTEDGERAGAAIQHQLKQVGVAKVVAVTVASRGLYDRIISRDRRAA